MKVLKASAGSGKTYNLARTYIDILLGGGDRYAYRHILAVTFTNKATAEMKSRILKDLRVLAKTDSRAGEMLVDILHDYGSFAVSTIDKFFQQTLKSFSREIGQFADYQIELDKASLIKEAMDRILDSLTEESKDLVKWIKASMSDRLETGRRFNLDEGLFEMGLLLKSEEHRELAEKFGTDDTEAYGKSRLDAIRKECREVIGDFETRASACGLEVTRGEKIKKPGVRVLKASEELNELFGAPFRRYNTARIIDNLIFSLGLAGEFYKEFSALLKEKNLMCLDESNTILRDIIDGSDAPFVYEKLGVRFENFLLDEFQDTSNIQWENFLPLLKESESKGGKNLIVGDVKQSIYRFRDSDWTLLGSEVFKAFPGADVAVLDSNWRSAREIVNFNNGFFTFAAKILGLSDIYADVCQKVKAPDLQPGMVKVDFCEDQMNAIAGSLEDARSAGAEWGDIAILVRGRRQGADVASFLIGRGIPVISDDSLSVKTSPVVRRLVSLLSCLENPEDKTGSYLADSMNLEFPGEYHSLIDLSEELLRSLRDYEPGSFEGESLFIQAFMDDLVSWTGVNGNNLRNFLKHWEESDLFIGSPENTASVRILTIHKSKGLEFPYVIFPFAEKVDLYKNGVHWCHFDGGIYPVELGPSSEDTLFAEDYHEERRKQAVDNINLFYVALTRAGKCLHIIAGQPTKKCRESLAKGRPEYGNFSEILYDYTGRFDSRVYGDMYDFGRMTRETGSGEMDFPSSYPSFRTGGRLSPSAEASDFFGEDGFTGTAASRRRYGIALHHILSMVEGPDDLEPALDFAVRDGRLSEAEGKRAGSFLARRIASHPEWFPSDGTRSVRNEMTLFDRKGRECRPDRVVSGADGTLVIDYKFGAEKEEAYANQVLHYVDLYRSMGYRNVRGFVWYVTDDVVTAV